MNRLGNWKRVHCGATATAIVLLAAAVGARAAEELPVDLVSCLNQANRANAAHDIELERRVLDHAETLQGDAKDAAEVQRRLAVLDWKYHHRFDEARSRLLRATESGAEPAKAWIALARMEQAREDHAAVREAANRALETVRKDSVRRAADLAVSRASVAEAAELRRNGEVGDTEALRAAFDDLHSLVTREPGDLEPSRLLLRAAVLLDRGDAALLAWRSYYHVAPGYPAPNAIAGAGEELKRILPGWQGAGAESSERIALVKALADTRFFTEAAMVALDPRTNETVRENSRVRQVVAYARAIRKVREVTEEFYRQTILGGGDPDEFEDQVKAQAAPVLMAMGIDLQPPPSDDELDALFDEHFGAQIMLGRTAGYNDLHMGHRVIDETRTVQQYGHEAELRFVALDSMVSNGFQSWAWKSGAHGGWADSDTIWQVRPEYAGSAVQLWRRLQSEQEMAEYAERLERETALDDERARDDRYGFLPGLALRLGLQGVKGVQERLEQQGLAGEDLRLAFLAEYERTVQESSIFAHEGRHAIDLSLGTKMRSGGKTEYYAKLSEAVFTTDPRLALGGIFSATIGDPTPHGQANLRIMKGLVKWMKKHRDEIRGLDLERPLLPQFDLLSDEQIREAFRSMDPFAK
jgi:hypothetical protein